MQRTYHAVALGSPGTDDGSVATNIARDLSDRKRMAAATYNGARCVTGIHVVTRVKRASRDVCACEQHVH